MLRVLLVYMLLLALTPRPGWAQEGDVQAAAAAFRTGQQAQLSGDFARAAEFFELADAAAPTPQALRSAIRNHAEAGNVARAATLSLRALERYAADSETRELAQQILLEYEPALGRIAIRCEPECGILVDGRAVDLRRHTSVDLFVTPGTRTVEASFDEGDPLEREAVVEAGQHIALRFEPTPVTPIEEPPATEPEPSEPETTPTPVLPPPPPGYDPPPIRPLRITLWTSVAATALLGALYTWSLVDTLALRETYRDDPTEDRYNDGMSGRRRTIVLGTLAGALAAETVLVAILTARRNRELEPGVTRIQPGFFASSDSAGLTLALEIGHD